MGVNFYSFAIAPFLEHAFMQRSLIGVLLLALSACPLGVFLMLRRMSLTGDAMSHAILPGVALGFLFFGLELIPMTIGGLLIGWLVAVAAGAVSRLTSQKEDASLAAFYLISLAAGVTIISMRGSSVDLMHLLFGSVLAMDNTALYLITAISSTTLVVLAIIWRALVAECLDPLFLRSVSRWGALIHFVFLALVVLNLVGGFQALGTLLVVGLMMLPAATARFWSAQIRPMCILAIGFGATAAISGLLLSYHAALPSGPAIVLAAGSIYLVSLFIGPNGIIATHKKPISHRTA